MAASGLGGLRVRTLGFRFGDTGPPIGPSVAPFWGLPYRILNVIHKKELLRGLWVGMQTALQIRFPV